MWDKIKKPGYLMSAGYVLSGTVLAVLLFQFVTSSMITHKLLFSSLIAKRTMAVVVASVVGIFVTGLIQFLIAKDDEKKEQADRKVWEKLKEKNKASILIKASSGFSFGGFIGLLTGKIASTDIDNDFFQTLFSRENIINYIGIVLAASVFGMLFTLGTIKRLRLIYGN